jgi:hypothetical protein
MSYEVVTIPPFEKQLKRLTKKYPSLKSEFSDLIERLELNPAIGTSIGNNCYKIRLAIASKGKGKSGGARVITYLQLVNNLVFLLSVFDKSAQENIPDSELTELLKLIP